MRRRELAIGAALIAIMTLGGCAPAAPVYPAEVASQLQSQVLEVTTAAAESDFEAAMEGLAALEVALNDALARGDISQARYDSIRSAIDPVRLDLEEAIASEDEDLPGNDDDSPGNSGEKPGKKDD